MTQHAFDDRVAAYAVSPCHQSGPSLPLVIELTGVSAGALVLDIATGTGFTAHALVQRGACVDALDVSRPMLRHARATAPAPLRALRAAADQVPVRGGRYDVITCRHALHHFGDPLAAIHEMARVVRPGGCVVIADTQSPDDPCLAAEMNDIETIRDPSHVRNLSAAELAGNLRAAGLTVAAERDCRSPLDVDQWVARSGGTPRLANDLWCRLSAPPAATTFEAREDAGVRRFSWPVRVVMAVRPNGAIPGRPT